MLNWRKSPKWLLAWGAPFAIFGLIIFGAFSLRAPVPTERYEQCLQTAQKHRPKQTECKRDESLWERSLIDPVAYYTLWLTIFTGALAAVGIAQWALISRQIDLANEEFIATHRPRLRVRRIQTDGINIRDDIGAELLPTWIYIVNVGDSSATEIRFDARFCFYRTGSKVGNLVVDSGARLPPWTEEIRPEFSHGPRKLIAGESGVYTPTFSALSAATIAWIRQKRADTFLIGSVVYKDGIGTERNTGFSWRYDLSTGEFAKPEKEDSDNYED